jgi:hypothetical protein
MEYERENIDFQLPNNKVTLEFLKLSKIDRQKVVGLGLKFLRMGNHHVQTFNNEQWEKKLETLSAEKDKVILGLQEQITSEKEKHGVLCRSHREQNQLLVTDTKHQVEARFQSELKEAALQMKTLKDRLYEKSRENEGLYKSAYREFEEKLTVKERHWEERMDKMRASYEEKLQRETSKTEATIVKMQNSTLKGQDGENFTYFELNKRFPKASIEDTRKQTGRGDFIFKDDAFTMLIETKNYKKNVTKPEIDKFYRDIDINHDIQCGILISLKSGICAREDFHLEIRDDKPILFLHNVATNMKHVDLAIELFKLILKTECIDLNNKEILDKLKNNIPMIKRNWNKMRQKIQKFEREMMASVLSQETMVRGIFELLSLKY